MTDNPRRKGRISTVLFRHCDKNKGPPSAHRASQQMPSLWSYFSCVGLALSASQVKAFTFTTTTPAQCQNLTVSWTGGQPPFKLLIIPPTNPLRTLIIPSSAYEGNSGSFSTPLLFSQNQRLMLSMSDATGITAGGFSELLTVGPPQGARICNTTDPGADFYFSLDSDLQQCKSYPFTLYSGGAIQPINITGFVPMGNYSFVLNPPIGDSFSWTANLTAGMSVVFSMMDSKGRNGGTSGVEVVTLTNDTSCLTTKQTSNSNLDHETSKKASKITTIVVAVVGGLVFIGIAAFLFLRFIRPRRSKSGYGPAQTEVDFPYDPLRSTFIDPFILPEGNGSTPFDHHVSPHDNALVSPFILPTEQQASTAIPPTSQSKGVNVLPQSSNSNVAQGHQSRVILHTDIEESMELPLELPPEYSETRALIPGLSAPNDAGPSSAPAPSRTVATANGKRV